MFTKLRLKAAIGAVALTAIAVFSLTGCTAFFDLFTPTGTVSGTVWSSTTASGVADVAITVVGHTSFHTTTDSSGTFSFSVPQGTMVLHFALTGYDFSDVTVTVVGGEITAVSAGDLVANPVLTSGEYRFVLTWAATPRDLDSHLLTPQGQHVYFSDKTPTGAGASLDVDNTSGYGPETITVSTVQTGTYTYYVHNYSGDADLTASAGLVRFYNSAGLAQTFAVPTTGTGRYWLVLTLNGTTGAVTATGTITDTSPVAGFAPAPKVSR